MRVYSRAVKTPLLLLFLAACAAAPSTIERVAQATVDAPLPEPAIAREVYAPTACQARGGVNPMVFLPRAKRPIVGREFSVVFASRGVAPRPNDLCVLVQSLRPAVPIDFSPYGFPGCWLLVNLDTTLVLPTEGGLATWRWTPTIPGVHLWLQLLVFAPGENAGGIIASPAVEIITGAV